MEGALTRRRLLTAAGAGGLAFYTADARLLAQATTFRKAPIARGGKFDLGVMSGDPSHRAMTLWTRLGDVGTDRVQVELEIAKDPTFRNVVARRFVPTANRRDHTIKVRVGNLEPDRRYFYRFETKGAQSPVGRFQTAPPPDSNRPVKFAFFSCQDYVSGFYGAYRKLVEFDPDFVICLGDYIYEKIFYPVVPGRPDTTGSLKDGEVKTLDEYRQKYRLYRADADLQEMHRLVPFIAMGDDHEVEDNYAGGDPRSEDYDRPRTLSGWQAFFEYQPNMGVNSTSSYQMYRRLRYGRNVEMLLLDQRSYRDNQPCNDTALRPCDESGAPRNYLGRAQMNWLKANLRASSANWKVIGNQLMIMPFDVAPGLPVTQDSWEGYQAERTELLSHIRTADVKDVTFLTGDIHTYFAGQVQEFGRTGPVVATEFVGGSTTSPGTAEFVGEAAGIPPNPVQPVSDRLQQTNPWFSYAETRSHGFATVEVDAQQLRASYMASRDVATRAGAADVRTLQRFAVQRGTPRVNLA